MASAWPTDPWLVLGALALEAMVGYPDALHRRIPHPVAGIARLITTLERCWNHPGRARKALGILTVIVVAGVAAAVGALITHLAGMIPHAGIVIVVVATLGLAQRSLFDHVAAVIKPLYAGDVESARVAVARIVGRDVTKLNEGGIAAAALRLPAAVL